jgi:hypothetical protein
MVQDRMQVFLLEATMPPHHQVRKLVRRIRQIHGVICAIPIRSKQSVDAAQDGVIALCNGEEAASRLTAGARHAQIHAKGWRTRTLPLPATTALERPIVILGAPRAGTTLLFETLAELEDVWTIGRESHGIIESKLKLRPPDGRESNRLTVEDADQDTIEELRAGFISGLRDRSGTLLMDALAHGAQPRIRFVEKTPRNCLRVPFIHRVFPDARFIFLHRDARENISSLIEGWNSGRFVSYRLDGDPWSFILPPNWQAMDRRDRARLAAFQWKSANEYCLNDLARLPREQWISVGYSDLTANPVRQIRRICQFAGIRMDARFEASLRRPLPHSSSTLSAPREGKWRAHASELETVMAGLQSLSDRILSIDGASHGL